MSARPGPSGGYHVSDIPTGIELTPVAVGGFERHGLITTITSE